MAGESFDAMAVSLANVAYATWRRRLVFQRLPTAGEVQTDTRGFPTETPTDLQDVLTESIPCQIIVQNGKDVIVDSKPRTTTVYRFTVPRLYKKAPTNELADLPFSTGYRVHLLADGAAPEMVLDILTGGKDGVSPGIVFDAIKFES